MKRSAWARMRRNCHHFSTMKYHDAIENSTRIASTNLVSRLEVRTSSHGEVGIARPTCSSTLASRGLLRVPARVGLVPPPRGLDDLSQRGVARAPAEQAGGAVSGRHQHRRIARTARLGHRRDGLPRDTLGGTDAVTN